MVNENKVFLMDRETLHEIVGPSVNRDEEMLVVMDKIKGKEINASLRDENFALVKVRGIVTDKVMPKTSKMILEDWKGNKLPNPWSIKVLEIS